MKEYLIYCYISPSNKRYIGQTCESLKNRAGKNGIRYKDCSAFWRAIEKYGWEYFQEHSEVLAIAQSHEEADVLEKYYINYYHTTKKEYGYNILIGGYEGFGSLNECPVVGVNLDSQTVRIFNSYSEAARQIGVLESVISEIVRKTGRYTTTHHWTFLSLDEYEKMSDKDKKNLLHTKIMKKPKLSKRVKCVTTGEIFSSITEAAIKKNCSRTHISSVCNGIRASCGKDTDGTPLRWSYI